MCVYIHIYTHFYIMVKNGSKVLTINRQCLSLNTTELGLPNRAVKLASCGL